MRIRRGCAGDEMSGLIDDANPSALGDALLQEDIVQAESADNGGKGIIHLALADHGNADDIDRLRQAVWLNQNIADGWFPRRIYRFGTGDIHDRPHGRTERYAGIDDLPLAVRQNDPQPCRSGFQHAPCRVVKVRIVAPTRGRDRLLTLAEHRCRS